MDGYNRSNLNCVTTDYENSSNKKTKMYLSVEHIFEMQVKVGICTLRRLPNFRSQTIFGANKRQIDLIQHCFREYEVQLHYFHCLQERKNAQFYNGKIRRHLIDLTLKIFLRSNIFFCFLRKYFSASHQKTLFFFLLPRQFHKF